MANSASTHAGLLMAGPASAPDGVVMAAVVSPNVAASGGIQMAAAPAGIQMDATPDGLLTAAGVSPNARVSPNSAAAVPDGH
jgi:hypothetical protein